MKVNLTKIAILFAIILFANSIYSQTYSFTYQSIVRSYIVHLPTGYSASNNYSLVLNMHGYTGSASQQQSYTQMNTVADTGKFIVVYPDGVNNAWNCGAFGFNSNIDDVGFLSALIDTMKNKFSVNANKVFACGLSLGGFMSYRLACELSSKIAAIAPVSGLIADGVAASCQTTCPVPVMHFHGTADGVINYNGAAGYGSVDTAIQKWVAQDGCPSTPVTTNIPNINTTDNCTVTKYIYGPGQSNSEVVLFKITDGGHTWPGTSPSASLGNTNQDIKASGEIWSFFKKFSLQCPPTTVNENSYTGKISASAYPNPFNDFVKIGFELARPAETSVAVYNIYGNKIKQLAYQYNSAGVYSIYWDGRNERGIKIPVGIYLYVIRAGQSETTGKILLIE